MLTCTICTPEQGLETYIALLEGGVMITCFFACLLAPEALMRHTAKRVNRLTKFRIQPML